MTDSHLPLLSFAKTPIVGEKPFDGDYLRRRELAEKLTTYLGRLNTGAVLALDAPWGEGKTWFGKNWSAKLQEDGYKTVYIDAFEQDYVEDPFMLLAAELLAVTTDDSEAKTKIEQKAIGVLKATMSIGGKVGAGLLTKYVLGGVELNDEIEKAITELSAETVAYSSQLIEGKFKQYEQDKQTVSAFREELSQYASKQAKPIVIFIDELDRCKPDFAVSIIERIKHFFDVPNVVFVLLLNRDQLEKAVKGVYGSETDGASYLGKFINLFLKLPKVKPSDYFSERKIENFVVTTFHKYNFPNAEKKAEIMELLIFFSVQFELSLRDIERALSIFAFAYPIRHLDQILIYVVVLKQKDPKMFELLVDNDKEAHQTMVYKFDKMLEINIQNGGSQKYVLTRLQDWHKACASNFKEKSEDFIRFHNIIQQASHNVSYAQIFSYFANLIDLEMER